MFCNVLHALSCSLVFCTVLLFSTVFRTLLHCVLPLLQSFCSVLHCPVLTYTVMRWPTVSCAILDRSSLSCIVLFFLQAGSCFDLHRAQSCMSQKCRSTEHYQASFAMSSFFYVFFGWVEETGRSKIQQLCSLSKPETHTMRQVVQHDCMPSLPGRRQIKWN